MFRRHRRALLRTACAAAAACAAQQEHGEGFRNPPPGTFSLSRAGGRIAQVDNAEAAYHNPANVVDIPAMTIEAAPGIVYFKVDHENGSSETTDPVKFLP